MRIMDHLLQLLLQATQHMPPGPTIGFSSGAGDHKASQLGNHFKDTKGN